MTISSIVLLGLCALIVRAIAVCIRSTFAGIGGSIAGGMACGVAVWMAGGIAGAWSPLWPAVAAGVFAGLGLLAVPCRIRTGLGWIGDLFIFVVVSQLSVPPLELGPTAFGAACVGATALALDASGARIPAALRIVGLFTGAAGATVGAIVLAFAPPWSLRENDAPNSFVSIARVVANLGIVADRDYSAIRIELTTGAVAWLETPSAGTSPHAALFFHGNTARGSRQPAAIVARRALRAAGFTVLSVDHPGYGASPSPDGSASLDAWDPLSTALAALEFLRKDSAVTHVIAVGHSMGTVDALRLLTAGADVDGAILFGASLPVEGQAEYWRGRFLAERGLAPGSIPNERVGEILDRYYDIARYVAKLGETHPPIVYGRFMREWPDIRSSRDTLYAQIPGLKVVWDVPGSHYFSSISRAGVIVGDVRVTHDISERLARIADDLRSGGAIVCASDTEGMDRTGRQWEPYIEWRLCNPTYAGNPFDLIASATFEHAASGQTITTEMFFDGNDTWKFRFTPTAAGLWKFTTASDDHELNGHTGRITVQPNVGANGFLTNFGSKWGWSGTGRTIAPQFVMYGDPSNVHHNPTKIDADIKTFLVEHGFTGFHIVVGCRWFDLDSSSCETINLPNPDRRTFEALEILIGKVHAAGGAVHIWAWGDEQRAMTPMRWGLDSDEARRLERYIAARLGPIPGWSMGYGFDLYEWVTRQDLMTWHEFMTSHMGWPHLLGGRGPTNQLREIYDGLDYASFEQHRPDYRAYRAAMDAANGRPVFSEDRFRIRDNPRYADKDYTMEMTRRGLWHSTMAGGVANIWGNLQSGSIVSEQSLPYPRPEWIKSYAEFFRDRFLPDMAPCDDSPGPACLKDRSRARYVFYAEDAKSIDLELSSVEHASRAIAVDTLRAYAEIELGTFRPSRQTWIAPYRSDWAIAVGDFPRLAAE